jgi:fructose-1,6-bisphosphatase/inositol monophosphatase family enzyme
VTDADITLALALADAAGAAIRPFFRRRFVVETKDDQSPVTEVDRAAEGAMRAILAERRPATASSARNMARARACRAAVGARPDRRHARLHRRARDLRHADRAARRRPAGAGIIDQPISGERWIGARRPPTLFGGEPARTRPCPIPARALLATTSPWLFDAAGSTRFDAVRAGCGDTLLGGDCYNYGLLAAGHVDLVIEQGLKLFDFAALVPVVEGAGGRMCDWQGRDLDADSTGEVVAAGDPRLLDSVLPLLG